MSILQQITTLYLLTPYSVLVVKSSNISVHLKAHEACYHGAVKDYSVANSDFVRRTHSDYQVRTITLVTLYPWSLASSAVNHVTFCFYALKIQISALVICVKTDTSLVSIHVPTAARTIQPTPINQTTSDTYYGHSS